ncbi:MAG: NUDIX domain-containing protein [Nanoarchaeota archaeon]|nr:NUDIX domain-containing protein [Nanoarchaeota archaeon]
MKDINGNELKDDVEYIIHCKSDGTIVAPIPKEYAHKEGVRPKLTHYSTWAMVYNPTLRKYGLQLKQPKKHDGAHSPKWDVGVAGHNCYEKKNGEYKPLSFEENLIKETDEEIGLDVKVFYSLNEFLEASKELNGTIGYICERFHYRTSINNEWVGFGLILTTKTDLEFKDKEVLKFRWLSPDELKKYLDEEDNYYSALPIIFEKAEKFRLKYLT